ncbi:MAG TPA: LuxR C-terminal-related transcriptional regulator [Candidatus Baltobacteraceae bacterium]|nr:LuxR C-terminal-related transcriptional regulator [Candidatus Baltobacteraceae bacterium]
MPQVVSRPRVEQRLREAIAHSSLTVLHAPLGAGKSSALALALRDRANVVWVDARPWHSGTVAREIAEAIRTVREEFGRATLGAIEGSSAAHLGRLFARELSHVDDDLTVVVDNMHVLGTGDRFFRFVDAAVSEIPDRVKIVAVGRSLPQTPLLRTFARRRVTVLEPELFKLDESELAAFARAFGASTKPEDLAHLAELTEGWAAGAVLALTAPGQTLGVAARSLLNDLGRQNLAFLEDASVLEAIDAAVADPRTLDDLLRRGALLEQTAPGTYRLHPMLRELLRKRLEDRGGLAQAHANAARSYARAGNVAAALHHAESAGDLDAIETLFREHADAIAATGERERIERLGDAVLAANAAAPGAAYVKALLAKAGGSERTRELFAQAADLADRARAGALAFGARAQTLEYDLGRLERVAPEALADLAVRARDLGGAEQVRAAMLAGWSRAVAHDFAGALAVIEPLLNVDDDAAQFNAGILRAYAQTALGDVEGAQRSLDALTARLERGDGIVLQTLTLVWFARLALLWGHTTAGAEAAAQAQRLATALDLHADEAALLAALCELSAHHGNVGATVQYADRARTAGKQAWYEGDRARIEALAGIALARAAFLGHDNAIARDLALRAAAADATPPVQRATALTEACIYVLLCDPPASAGVIAQARAAVAAAVPLDAFDAAALSVADDILAFLDEANGMRHDSLLRGCAPFAGLLEHRRGLVTLELAGVAAGNARRGTTGSTTAFNTAIEMLTREGPRFEAVLVRAYASTFIKTKRAAAPAPPDPSEFDLTARENEILALLVEGLTNKEIAQRLVVSPRTIETHVERVLGKLGVGSRSRAIAKAVRTGLVRLESAVP